MQSQISSGGQRDVTFSCLSSRGGVGSVQMSSIREHSKETRKLYNMEVYDLFTSFEQSQSNTSSCLEVII